MRDLRQFFAYLNDIDFKYVVIRNWENLPDNVETGIHSDLDLLVYDFDHFLEIFPQLERVYPAPRVQFKLHLDNGEYVQIDVRSIGDSYFPDEFASNMIETREWNKLGFFTPNPLHHRIGLSYHAVHHKNFNAYKNYLGDTSIAKMLEALKQNKDFAWVEPDDHSVGRFNSYQTGGTSVVSSSGDWVDKKQVRFKSYNLIDNEERILKVLDNPHFPKLIRRDGDNIRIEHCGEPLSEHNLPKDWKKQMAEIIQLLESKNIIHRDVRLDNLMLKDGVIKLVDFGWARLITEEDGKYPELLGYPNRCPTEFNDAYSMNRIIKQLEELEMEKSCQKEN